jgi:NodT family efflux transporter outer membrane factor (OMF) lipoprotein
MSRLHALLLAGAAACAVGPDFRRPDPPPITRYGTRQPERTLTAGGTAQIVRAGQQLAAAWWELFRSAQVDALVHAALAHNASLQVARANLKRSEYLMRAGYGVFYPQLDARASPSRQRFNPAQFGSTQPASVFNLYTLGGTISYTLDVFGGQRRSVEALRAQLDVQCYSLAAARLTVTSNVVNTAIARAGYAEAITASEELVKALREQVGIAKIQFEAGTAAYAPVLSLEAQLGSTAATIPPLRQRLAQSESLLATLVGGNLANTPLPALRLADLTLPQELPVVLPARLVRQRPDVLIAEATLHVSTANVGVATAALFPTITLQGSVGANSSSLPDLLSPSSFVWNLAANILAPIFHGGTLTNQRKAAIEAHRASLASYRDTVLAAVSNVEVSLSALVHDAELVVENDRALTAASGARDLLVANYRAGLANYLDVLTADVQYHRARITSIEARTQRLQDTVALFVAVGGGWSTSGEVPCAAIAANPPAR